MNAVSPGWTWTDLVEEWFRRQPDPAAAEASVIQAHPMRRIARPTEVANLVLFVASDEASAITGASLAVDCGLGIQFATQETRMPTGESILTKQKLPARDAHDLPASSKRFDDGGQTERDCAKGRLRCRR